MSQKPRGRPPLDRDDTSVHLGFKITAKKYAKLCAVARAEQTTLPEVIRRLIDLHTGKNKNP